MKKCLLASLLLFASAGAIAGWVEIGEEGGIKVYADPDTISKAGDTVKMWQMNTFRELQNIPRDYRSSRLLFEYDCKALRARGVGMMLYSGVMGTGEVVYSSDDIYKWSAIVPDSFGGKLRKIACGKK